jgi:DNA-binding LacI/PurR family transcriptional regulator
MKSARRVNIAGLGHHRIGLVGDFDRELGSTSTRRRLPGYRRALTRHWLPADLSVIRYDDIESAALLGLSTVRQPLCVVARTTSARYKIAGAA